MATVNRHFGCFSENRLQCFRVDDLLLGSSLELTHVPGVNVLEFLNDVDHRLACLFLVMEQR